MKKSKQCIQSYIKNKSCVRIYHLEEEFYCQILKFSQDFMLIRGLDDWHFDGYIIHMIKNIKNIKYNKLEIFREKITKTLQWYQDDHSVDWIDLSSWATIFQSLKDNYNEICIWGATEEVDQFMIGVITKFDDRYLLINKLTIFGKITKSEYQIPINEITHISFGDEYSRILFEYAKKHK